MWCFVRVHSKFTCEKMDNNITHYDTKIKRILEGFLQVNYKTKNDYLNSFILYLSSNEGR